jgi:hypothetical protein
VSEFDWTPRELWAAGWCHGGHALPRVWPRTPKGWSCSDDVLLSDGHGWVRTGCLLVEAVALSRRGPRQVQVRWSVNMDWPGHPDAGDRAILGPPVEAIWWRTMASLFRPLDTPAGPG